MINVLIADDNVNFLKGLVNDILNNMDIRICKICTNGKEALDVLKTEKIDIVILDINMPIYNGIDVLTKLTNLQKDKYKDSVIVMSEDNYSMPRLIGNPLVFDYIIKGTKKEEIRSRMKRLVASKNLLYKRKQIISELAKIGYDINYKGTTYLIDVIFQMYQKQKFFIDNLQRDIYPIVAKTYHKTINNIKCNINNATESMYYKCESKILKEYFSFYDDKKPTTKTVIYTVLNRIS